MTKLILDGELIEADSVRLPLLSRGYAFGYGVFETMKFLGGQPCFFGEHLQRLRRAVAGAGLQVSLDELALREQAARLFAAESVEDGVFKIVISDVGEGAKLALFVRSRGVFQELAPCRLRASRVVKSSQAFTSRHKTLNYMESVMELEKAKADGFDECVFRNEHGFLTECSIANLFFLAGGVLKTPRVECGLLDGIVRAKVMELACEMGIVVEEGAFGEADLLVADEVFLTSSGGGPRSVACFESSGGDRSTYAIAALPRLRSAYLELERREALGSRV